MREVIGNCAAEAPEVVVTDLEGSVGGKWTQMPLANDRSAAVRGRNQ
jgi:hypothetical protein